MKPMQHNKLQFKSSVEVNSYQIFSDIFILSIKTYPFTKTKKTMLRPIHFCSDYINRIFVFNN